MHFYSLQISTWPVLGLCDFIAKLALTAFCLLNLGCAAKQRISDGAQIYRTDFQYEDDQVLVLLVDIQPQSATLRKARLVDGDFRPVSELMDQRESIRVQYLDAKDQVLYEKILEHPLIQYKEYSDDQGKLRYVRIEEEKGSLLLRSQYSKAFRSIRIDYGENRSYRKISQLAIVVDD
jgi:hypothetical protein